MRFKVKESETIAHGGTYVYKRDWRGRRKRRRQAIQAGGKKAATQPIVQASFIHDRKVVNAGDVIESQTDLARAFPHRFERVEDEG